MIVEEAVFSSEQAVEFGRLITRQIANSGLWPGGVAVRTEPLPPYESKARLLPDGNSRPMPWLIEPMPRLELRLRARRHDIFGDELPSEELLARLRTAKREIATLLGEPVFFSDTLVEATVDHEEEVVDADDGRSIDLRFGLTLLEA